MPPRNLDKLFHPNSVAVIGASNRAGKPGNLIMHNLLRGGFDGPIMPVSGVEQAVAGVLAYRDIDALPVTPDLAVLCTPLEALPGMVHTLARRGTRAAMVLTEELLPEQLLRKSSAYDAAIAEARGSGLRLVGPNGLGIIVPGIGLNAAITHAPADAGRLAFVSHSTAISAAVLDWAKQHGIGFSHFVSLGDTADVDFGDVLDYLGSDPKARAILLYIESIRDGRTFLSAGRGASRNKPILVIKAGRAGSTRNLSTFRGGVADDADDVYDAAIRRAGMLRVMSFTELFAAVETLGRAQPLAGERLALLSNGFGLAVMAADAMALDGGTLAELSDDTEARLARIVPDGWPRTNPVTIAGDAPAESYAQGVRMLAETPEVDAVMVVHAPSTKVPSRDAARAVIGAVKATRANVLTSWMGGEWAENARRLFEQAGIPTYDTPTHAVDAFMHMVRFRRNREMLMQTPPSKPAEFSPATGVARGVVLRALDAGRSALGEEDVHAVLAAYGIATLHPDRMAHDDELTAHAAGHAVRQARIGVFGDSVFGPVISLGMAGAAASVYGGRAVARPPRRSPAHRGSARPHDWD